MNPDPDFNELDKAVNSLMGSKGTKPTNTASADKKTETSSPLKPHAGRGKFMDVVHPNSDMTTVVPPTSMPVNDGSTPAIGKTITPNNKDIKPEPAPEKDVDNLPVVKQLSPIDDADPKSLVATPDIAETAKPDPLEEATKKERERVARDGAKQRKAEHKADKKTEDHTPTEDKPTLKDESKTEDKPSEKPEAKPPLFLEDAKVEKRPLGAFNDEAPKESGEDKDEHLLAKAKADTQKTTTPPPPAEFDKAVVALEASDEVDADKTPKKETENFSIPPQYKQAKKPEAKPAETSIYEPANFSAFTDSHTPSNTKPWMWVIIFLGIVALGVALSLGTFFVVGVQ